MVLEISSGGSYNTLKQDHRFIMRKCPECNTMRAVMCYQSRETITTSHYHHASWTTWQERADLLEICRIVEHHQNAAPR